LLLVSAPARGAFDRIRLFRFYRVIGWSGGARAIATGFQAFEARRNRTTAAHPARGGIRQRRLDAVEEQRSGARRCVDDTPNLAIMVYSAPTATTPMTGVVGYLLGFKVRIWPAR
jgi:hypothetical protein